MIYLGLQYIDATPEHERPAEIPRLEVRVPSRSGKAIERIAFKDCTTRDLERAVEGALAKPDVVGIDEDDLARVAKALLALARRR